MGTGQLLMTLGAMFILSLVILNINHNFLATGDVMLNTKFSVLAISLGTSMLEEANSKAYDHNTDTSSTSSLSVLTLHNQLGKETGEVYPAFNDFDDYNNFERTDSTMPSARFKMKCKVEYVNPNNPNQALNQRTWHKKLTVTVTSPSMRDTVILTTVFSYWFFR